jgi:hypothetical protein
MPSMRVSGAGQRHHPFLEDRLHGVKRLKRSPHYVVDRRFTPRAGRNPSSITATDRSPMSSLRDAE